jgi:hypothetical protein
MTCTDGTFMGLDTHEPRDRLARFLHRQYRGEHKTKRLATDINCTPKTAENILDGHWPTSRHWAAIARRFGRDVLDAVFGPEIDETTARLAEEVRQLEELLEEKRRRARQAAGVATRLEAVRARAQDRAAPLTGPSTAPDAGDGR